MTDTPNQKYTSDHLHRLIRYEIFGFCENLVIVSSKAYFDSQDRTYANGRTGSPSPASKYLKGPKSSFPSGLITPAECRQIK